MEGDLKENVEQQLSIIKDMNNKLSTIDVSDVAHKKNEVDKLASTLKDDIALVETIEEKLAKQNKIIDSLSGSELSKYLKEHTKNQPNSHLKRRNVRFAHIDTDENDVLNENPLPYYLRGRKKNENSIGNIEETRSNKQLIEDEKDSIESEDVLPYYMRKRKTTKHYKGSYVAVVTEEHKSTPKFLTTLQFTKNTHTSTEHPLHSEKTVKWNSINWEEKTTPHHKLAHESEKISEKWVKHTWPAEKLHMQYKNTKKQNEDHYMFINEPTTEITLPSDIEKILETSIASKPVQLMETENTPYEVVHTESLQTEETEHSIENIAENGQNETIFGETSIQKEIDTTESVNEIEEISNEEGSTQKEIETSEFFNENEETSNEEFNSSEEHVQEISTTGNEFSNHESKNQFSEIMSFRSEETTEVYSEEINEEILPTELEKEIKISKGISTVSQNEHHSTERIIFINEESTEEISLVNSSELPTENPNEESVSEETSSVAKTEVESIETISNKETSAKDLVTYPSENMNEETKLSTEYDTSDFGESILNQSEENVKISSEIGTSQEKNLHSTEEREISEITKESSNIEEERINYKSTEGSSKNPSNWETENTLKEFNENKEEEETETNSKEPITETEVEHETEYFPSSKIIYELSEKTEESSEKSIEKEKQEYIKKLSNNSVVDYLQKAQERMSTTPNEYEEHKFSSYGKNQESLKTLAPLTEIVTDEEVEYKMESEETLNPSIVNSKITLHYVTEESFHETGSTEELQISHVTELNNKEISFENEESTASFITATEEEMLNKVEVSEKPLGTEEWTESLNKETFIEEVSPELENSFPDQTKLINEISGEAPLDESAFQNSVSDQAIPENNISEENIEVVTEEAFENEISGKNIEVVTEGVPVDKSNFENNVLDQVIPVNEISEENIEVVTEEPLENQVSGENIKVITDETPLGESNFENNVSDQAIPVNYIGEENNGAVTEEAPLDESNFENNVSDQVIPVNEINEENIGVVTEEGITLENYSYDKSNTVNENIPLVNTVDEMDNFSPLQIKSSTEIQHKNYHSSDVNKHKNFKTEPSREHIEKNYNEEPNQTEFENGGEKEAEENEEFTTEKQLNIYLHKHKPLHIQEEYEKNEETSELGEKTVKHFVTKPKKFNENNHKLITTKDEQNKHYEKMQHKKTHTHTTPQPTEIISAYVENLYSTKNVEAKNHNEEFYSTFRHKNTKKVDKNHKTSEKIVHFKNNANTEAIISEKNEDKELKFTKIEENSHAQTFEENNEASAIEKNSENEEIVMNAISQESNPVTEYAEISIFNEGTNSEAVSLNINDNGDETFNNNGLNKINELSEKINEFPEIEEITEIPQVKENSEEINININDSNTENLNTNESLENESEISVGVNEVPEVEENSEKVNINVNESDTEKLNANQPLENEPEVPVVTNKVPEVEENSEEINININENNNENFNTNEPLENEHEVSVEANEVPEVGENSEEGNININENNNENLTTNEPLENEPEVSVEANEVLEVEENSEEVNINGNESPTENLNTNEPFEIEHSVSIEANEIEENTEINNTEDIGDIEEKILNENNQKEINGASEENGEAPEKSNDVSSGNENGSENKGEEIPGTNTESSNLNNETLNLFNTDNTLSVEDISNMLESLVTEMTDIIFTEETTLRDVEIENLSDRIRQLDEKKKLLAELEDMETAGVDEITEYLNEVSNRIGEYVNLANFGEHKKLKIHVLGEPTEMEDLESTDNEEEEEFNVNEIQPVITSGNNDNNISEQIDEDASKVYEIPIPNINETSTAIEEQKPGGDLENFKKQQNFGMKQQNEHKTENVVKLFGSTKMNEFYENKQELQIPHKHDFNTELAKVVAVTEVENFFFSPEDNENTICETCVEEENKNETSSEMNVITEAENKKLNETKKETTEFHKTNKGIEGSTAETEKMQVSSNEISSTKNEFLTDFGASHWSTVTGTLTEETEKSRTIITEYQILSNEHTEQNNSAASVSTIQPVKEETDVNEPTEKETKQPIEESKEQENITSETITLSENSPEAYELKDKVKELEESNTLFENKEEERTISETSLSTIQPVKEETEVNESTEKETKLQTEEEKLKEHGNITTFETINLSEKSSQANDLKVKIEDFEESHTKLSENEEEEIHIDTTENEDMEEENTRQLFPHQSEVTITNEEKESAIIETTYSAQEEYSNLNAETTAALNIEVVGFTTANHETTERITETTNESSLMNSPFKSTLADQNESLTSSNLNTEITETLKIELVGFTTLNATERTVESTKESEFVENEEVETPSFKTTLIIQNETPISPVEKNESAESINSEIIGFTSSTLETNENKSETMSEGISETIGFSKESSQSSESSLSLDLYGFTHSEPASLKTEKTKLPTSFSTIEIYNEDYEETSQPIKNLTQTSLSEEESSSTEGTIGDEINTPPAVDNILNKANTFNESESSKETTRRVPPETIDSFNKINSPTNIETANEGEKNEMKEGSTSEEHTLQSGVEEIIFSPPNIVQSTAENKNVEKPLKEQKESEFIEENDTEVIDKSPESTTKKVALSHLKSTSNIGNFHMNEEVSEEVSGAEFKFSETGGTTICEICTGEETTDREHEEKMKEEHGKHIKGNKEHEEMPKEEQLEKEKIHEGNKNTHEIHHKQKIKHTEQYVEGTKGTMEPQMKTVNHKSYKENTEEMLQPEIITPKGISNEESVSITITTSLPHHVENVDEIIKEQKIIKKISTPQNFLKCLDVAMATLDESLTTEKYHSNQLSTKAEPEIVTEFKEIDKEAIKDILTSRATGKSSPYTEFILPEGETVAEIEEVTETEETDTEQPTTITSTVRTTTKPYLEFEANVSKILTPQHKDFEVTETEELSTFFKLKNGEILGPSGHHFHDESIAHAHTHLQNIQSTEEHNKTIHEGKISNHEFHESTSKLTEESEEASQKNVTNKEEEETTYENEEHTETETEETTSHHQENGEETIEEVETEEAAKTTHPKEIETEFEEATSYNEHEEATTEEEREHHKTEQTEVGSKEVEEITHHEGMGSESEQTTSYEGNAEEANEEVKKEHHKTEEVETEEAAEMTHSKQMETEFEEATSSNEHEEATTEEEREHHKTEQTEVGSGEVEEITHHKGMESEETTSFEENAKEATEGVEKGHHKTEEIETEEAAEITHHISIDFEETTSYHEHEEETTEEEREHHKTEQTKVEPEEAEEISHHKEMVSESEETTTYEEYREKTSEEVEKEHHKTKEVESEEPEETTHYISTEFEETISNQENEEEREHHKTEKTEVGSEEEEEITHHKEIGTNSEETSSYHESEGKTAEEIEKEHKTEQTEEAEEITHRKEEKTEFEEANSHEKNEEEATEENEKKEHHKTEETEFETEEISHHEKTGTESEKSTYHEENEEATEIVEKEKEQHKTEQIEIETGEAEGINHHTNIGTESEEYSSQHKQNEEETSELIEEKHKTEETETESEEAEEITHHKKINTETEETSSHYKENEEETTQIIEEQKEHHKGQEMEINTEEAEEITHHKIMSTESEENTFHLTEEGNEEQENVEETSQHEETEETSHHEENGNEESTGLVIVVNDSKEKISHLNASELSKVIHKPLDDMKIVYVDMNQFKTEESSIETPNFHPKISNKDTTEQIKVYLPGNVISSCTEDEFKNKKNCFCDVHNLLANLENSILEKKKVKATRCNCGKYIHLDNKLIITNQSVPVIRKKRSHIHLKYSQSKLSDIVEMESEEAFSDNYTLTVNDYNIYAFPGKQVRVHCCNSSAPIGKSKIIRWEFKQESSDKAERLPITNELLTIDDLEPKNSGNYTCILTDKNIDEDTEESKKEESYEHEVEVITLPIYKVQINIFYFINTNCNLADEDILHAYLPKIFSTLLCGYDDKVCKVSMLRPRCLTKKKQKYFNVTITPKIEPLQELLSIDELEACDLNCQINVYSNVVGAVMKNAEMISKLPVEADFGRSKLKFTPKSEVPDPTLYQIKTKPPKVLITCPAGFGIEKEKHRICVVCPKHTFSAEDESYCQVCPPGQYQTQIGSKSCQICASPVDDTMCLRMIYSDTKLFKIYVGIAFGSLLLLIVGVLYCINSMKETQAHTHFEGSYRYFAYQKPDVESGAAAEVQPLLMGDEKTEEKRSVVPPQVPPPDFSDY